MALSERVQLRVANWKFGSAWKITQEETAAGAVHDPHDEAVIRALAEMLGNPGWFEGNLGVIVGAVVYWLLADPAESL